MSAHAAHLGPIFEAERRHRLTRAAKLREVLSDGMPHTSTELARLVGHRFGAAILTVRRGDDMEPAWDITKRRLRDDGSVWEYQLVGLAPPGGVRPRPSYGQLLSECRRLRARIAELEAVRP